MLRPATTGLATAFFRLHLLDGLSGAPARPASLLTRVAAEKLPFASGAFSRALQSLLEGGYLVPARDGMVALTALGAAERVAERERWAAVIPSVMRLLGDGVPRQTAVVAEAAVAPYRAKVADAYAERVLVAYVRDRVAAAREGGRPFSVVLAVIGIEHANEPTRRAMLHRTIRASLGGIAGSPVAGNADASSPADAGADASIDSPEGVADAWVDPPDAAPPPHAAVLFGGDVTAFRYGEEGVSLVAARPEHQPLATLARARIDEVVRSMTSNVRAFHGARWRIHAGGATWSTEIGTTGALLRAAEEALRADSEVLPAA